METLINKKRSCFPYVYELTNIKIENNKIIYALAINNNNRNNEFNIIADNYVFGLPVEVLDKIIDIVPELNYGELIKIKKIKEKSLHTQLGFQLYFNKPISLGVNNSGEKNNAFLIVDSAWDLIVLSYDNLYKNTKLCNQLPNVLGGWSVVSCTSYVNGIVFNKPMDKCNYDEIIIELWQQIISSKQLKKLISDNNNFELSKDLIVK